MCNKFNGWENKPTWLIGLWADNTPGMTESLINVIQNSNDPESALKEFFEDIYDYIISESGLLSDLLGWCLAIVDWQAIVEKFEPEEADPYFDRFDICEAYQQIEIDYNIGGILFERKSNLRRFMSTDHQLNRMEYKRSILHDSYDDLSENGKAIYNLLKKRYDLE